MRSVKEHHAPITSDQSSAPSCPWHHPTSFFLAAVLLASSLLTGPAAHAEDISGTYVGIYANAADLLQIVERPDHSILGRFEQASLPPGAQHVERYDASVTGAVNHGVIVLTLAFQEPTRQLQMSGSVSGDVITLSGGGPSGDFTIVIRQGDAGAYASKAASMTAAAGKARAVDARIAAFAKSQVDMGKVTAWMEQYVKTSSAVLKYLAPLPAAYRNVTQEMKEGLAKERELPRASYARGTLDYNISALSYTFSGMHSFLEGKEWGWNYSDGHINNPNVTQAIAEAQSFCSLSNDQGSQENPACTKFNAARVAYDATLATLIERFSATESVWQTEEVKQAQIVKEADALAK